MKKHLFFFIMLTCIGYTSLAQTVTDIDGNVYETVTIGTQCWMKSNLKTTKYRDGSSIKNGSDSSLWESDTIGAFCYFNNSIDSCSTYGALYNWYAATNTHNIAPEGWHIPTDAEWDTLVGFLGSGTGGQLKEVGTEHWKTPNTSATNSSGFTALGAGFRLIGGSYLQMKLYCSWWSTSIYSESSAWSHELYYISPGILNVFSDKNYGFSIRCVKDVASGMDKTENKNDINMFPNPASNHIIINYSQGLESQTDISIYNVGGEQVLMAKLENKTQIQLDVSSFAKGVYFVKFLTKNGIDCKKLVIQ